MWVPFALVLVILTHEFVVRSGWKLNEVIGVMPCNLVKGHWFSS
jgi:hypothetical protein